MLTIHFMLIDDTESRIEFLSSLDELADLLYVDYELTPERCWKYNLAMHRPVLFYYGTEAAVILVRMGDHLYIEEVLSCQG